MFTSPQVACSTHTGLHLGLLTFLHTICTVRFVVGGLVVPRTRRRIGDRAFCVAAPQTWNRLMTDLKLLRSTDSFRQELKRLLFDSVYGHQRTDWSALWCAVGLLVGVQYKYLSYCYCYCYNPVPYGPYLLSHHATVGRLKNKDAPKLFPFGYYERIWTHSWLGPHMGPIRTVKLWAFFIYLSCAVITACNVGFMTSATVCSLGTVFAAVCLSVGLLHGRRHHGARGKLYPTLQRWGGQEGSAQVTTMCRLIQNLYCDQVAIFRWYLLYF